MKALLLIVFLWLATAATAAVVVAVSPSTVTVNSAAQQQFSAVVTGGGKADLTVAWKTSVGSINAAGLFTAPTVTEQETVTVTAARTAHPKQLGTATITVVPVGAIQHTVDLTWNADSGAVSYNMYRGTVSGTYSLLASAITSTTFTDATVVSGETYYYVVTAAGEDGDESGYSNVATAVIPNP
jgi:hypothetical protein